MKKLDYGHVTISKYFIRAYMREKFSQLRYFLNVLPSRVEAKARQLAFWTNAEAELLYTSIRNTARNNGKHDNSLSAIIAEEQLKLARLKKAMAKNSGIIRESLKAEVERQQVIVNALMLASCSCEVVEPEPEKKITEAPAPKKEKAVKTAAKKAETTTKETVVKPAEKATAKQKTEKEIRDLLNDFRTWEKAKLDGKGEYYRRKIATLEVIVKATEKSQRFFLLEPGKELKDSVITKTNLIAAIRAAREGA